MKYSYCLFLFLLSVSLISCQNDSISEIENEDCANVLFFQNDEEMFAEMDFILNANLDEKLSWQETKGFKSQGIIADDFYISIDFESFKSKEDLINFVNKHPNLLVIEEVNGDLHLETTFHNSPFRYFMNEDQIFQVGNNYYKVLSDLRIEADIESLEKLKLINELNLDQFNGDCDIRLMYNVDPKLKSSDCYSGKPDEQFSEPIETGGRWYKTWLKIYPMQGNSDNKKKVSIQYEGGCKVRRLGVYIWNHETKLYYSTNSRLLFTGQGYTAMGFTDTMPYDSGSKISSFHMKCEAVAWNGFYDYDANPRLSFYNYSVWSDAGVGDDGEGKITVTCP